MIKFFIYFLSVPSLIAFSQAIPKIGAVAKTHEHVGMASFYAERFHGRKTANRELYDREKMTAAHRTLPLGTVVEVKNIRNGRKVTVRINDRGPFAKGRILDVSSRAAKKLGFYHRGVTKVTVRKI